MADLPTRLRSAAAPLARRVADRLDAGMSTQHGSTSGHSGSAVLNALSGLGAGRDSGAAARPNLEREYLSPEELVALMRGSVYRRIVELLPKWATVRGWTVSDNTTDPRPMAEAMRRLRLRQVVRRADIWGRALGESRVLLVTDDMDRLDQPLQPARVKALHRLEVLDRREFTPVAFEGDVSRGPLGQPVLYQVTPMRSAGKLGGRIHASRLLRFHGDELPPSQEAFNGWGWGSDAIGQTLWDGIRHMAQSGSAGARLAQELSVAVFKMKRSPAAGAGDQRANALSLLALMNVMKSVANSVLLTPDDSYERVNANATGFKDLSEGARLELALLAGYPMALLFGEAPSGLSTDASSWLTNWHANVGSHREERYRDPLETVVELLYYTETGSVPDEWSLDFAPLGDLSERERADIRLVHTQADQLAIMDGVIRPDEARKRYTEAGGYAFDLQPVSDDPGPPDVDPDVEAEARALVEQLRLAGPPAEEPDLPRTDATEGAVWIGAALPESAVDAWRQARAAVEAVTGPLDDPGDDPHVTVLWMGQVAPEALPEILATARSIAERIDPSPADACRARVFAPGEHSEGRWPVVLDVGQGWGLFDLHHRLLRGLAHLVTARQFPDYRAHLTLGYAADLTPEQQAAVAELDLPETEWVVGGVQIRYGAQVIATLPLAGRHDEAGAAK